MRIKRFWASTLILAMTFGLAACGGTSVDNPATTEAVEEQTVGNASENIAAPEDEEVDSELEKAIRESTLKGTGPAKLEDTLKTDESAGTQPVDGDAIIDLNFDDDETDGFSVYTKRCIQRAFY